MSARLSLLASLPLFLALLTACPASGDPESSGVLVLEAPARRSLPATARYCARDTLLSVAAADGSWSAALAARSSWPLTTPHTFGVDTLLDNPGSAALAARNLRDTLTLPLRGLSGTVNMGSGDMLAGRFEAAAGDSSKTRLAGHFDGLRVTLVCP